jgi:hypothetical protein
MKTYRCPVCGKSLTKTEYEKALKIHEAREIHLRHHENELKKKERELPQKIEEARIEAQRKEKTRAERLMSGWKNKVKTLEERINQIEKGSTPQTEGLEFEDKLTTRLKQEFPEDDIQHKGKGGDVLHIVKFDKKPAGVIIYECKRTPRIQSQHINQAHLAKQSREADFAVLVTTGQKKDFSGLAQMRGVLIVSPLGAIPLASLLRRHLIEMLRAEITKEKRSIIAQQLVKYITGPQFKNPIEEVVHLTSQLQDMIKEEAKEHFLIWKKRWDYYQTIHWDSSQIQENLRLVLHGKEPKAIAHPEVPPLQLPGSTEEK